MRALTLKTTLEYCDQYPTLEPAKGEALVRVLQAGICAADLQLVRGYMGFHGVPGHEFVGIVEEVSRGDRTYHHDRTAVDVTALVVNEITIVGSRCGSVPAGDSPAT